MIDAFILTTLPLSAGIAMLCCLLVLAALDCIKPLLTTSGWIAWSLLLGVGTALVYLGIWIEVFRGH